ncbi:MAG: type I glyceraldehyde-3-phosphate dehydrogenase [Chloroflexota bacterium]
MMKVAINGLGRIGRATLKILLETPELELVAINDLVPTDNLAYLLKYDTVYGRYDRKVDYDENHLIIDGKKYPVFHEKDPAQLPWEEHGVALVFESTGVFTTRPALEKHIEAGAQTVILSAPAKDETVPTVVYGVGKGRPDEQILSCASCTTNSITPVAEVMDRHFGVKKATLTTIHAYTSSQGIVDGPAKKWRRGRAAAQNFVPTTTGAAIATTKALPQYEGKFDGIAVRGPVPVGSVSDLVFLTERKTTVEEVNDVFRKEAQGEQYKGVMAATDDPIVSSDIIQDPHASVVDLTMTKVIDGDLVKILAWYDNEWGYSNQMVREAKRVARSRERAQEYAAGRQEA